MALGSGATHPQSLKVLCLPLDDRPCNFDAMHELGRVASIDVRLPPLSLVSSHSDQFEFEKLYDWLDFQLGWNEAAVISLEMFLYGGLIRSRKSAVSEEQALTRLERLFELLSRHKNTKVYLGCVLLRLSVTVNASQSEDDWRNIFRYSVLKDEAEGEANPFVTQELTELEQKIPSSLLSEYLAVRQRNFNLNKKVLEHVERLSYLIYGQEDCAPKGLHRKEKTEIAALASRLDSAERKKVCICTGADELASLLLMRAYMDARDLSKVKLGIQFVGDSGAALRRVSKYEDITVEQNIAAHLEPTPFELETGQGTSVLTVMFEREQADLCFAWQTLELSPSVADAIAQRKFDAVLDLGCANGANDTLMLALRDAKVLDKLTAFSAWNTSGNRLGTLLAHLALRTLAKTNGEFDEASDKRYAALHLLDDWLYQTRVRATLTEIAKSRGENIWALSKTAWQELSEECNRLLSREAQAFGLDHFAFEASLPWPRLFEVRIAFLT